MTAQVLAALSGSTEDDDLCAALRWIGPHVRDDPSNDALLREALLLGERLPEQARQLWHWWLTLSRPDGNPDRAEAPQALPDDLVAVLRWVVGRGSNGVHEYAALSILCAPFQRSLRELTRAAESYRALEDVVGALLAGAEDPNVVMSQVPEKWSSPALRDGRKSLILECFAARDRAWSSGGRDLPPLRAPRFARVAEPVRSLCLDLLAGLPGVSGNPLASVPEKLDLSSVGSPGVRWLTVDALAARGLPISPVPRGPEFWISALADAGAPWVDEAPAVESFLDVVRGLRSVGEGRSDVGAWLASLAGATAQWSVADRTAALDAAVTYCVGRPAMASAARLLEALPTQYSGVADRYLAAAMHDRHASELTMVAFNRRLDAIVADLDALSAVLA